MRISTLALIFFASSIYLAAQTPAEWMRVYTFDDSYVELNTTDSAWIGEGQGRVTLRRTYYRPQVTSGKPALRYSSELDLFEFNCTDRQYRPWATILLNAAGQVVQYDGASSRREWKPIGFGTMAERYFLPGCRLLGARSRPPEPSAPTIASAGDRAEALAFLFFRRLRQTRDLTPLVPEFFAPNYLNGYLQDKNGNWFLTLDRETAARLTPAELQRYYLAAFNAGYLSSVYLIDRAPAETERETTPVAEEKLFPPAVMQIIKNHPYTRRYQAANGGSDYLAETIDTVERAKSYTDLLERVSAVLRPLVVRTGADRSDHYRDVVQDASNGRLWESYTENCLSECFGLPKGTQLLSVEIPLLRLQVAEINGQMKIVSLAPIAQ